MIKTLMLEDEQKKVPGGFQDEELAYITIDFSFF